MAFNKMFVMLPVMLAARKLDGEDPQVSTVGKGVPRRNPRPANHTTLEAQLETRVGDLVYGSVS